MLCLTLIGQVKAERPWGGGFGEGDGLLGQAPDMGEPANKRIKMEPGMPGRHMKQQVKYSKQRLFSQTLVINKRSAT